jgi:putative endonuclease
VNTTRYTHKDRGVLGEKVAAEYLRRYGFEIIDGNVSRKSGELDIIAKKEGCLHFVEVKSLACEAFPRSGETTDRYDPAFNLHTNKLRKVVRTAEWYCADIDWEGEWQVDAVFVWLRFHDRMARVSYVPQVS